MKTETIKKIRILRKKGNSYAEVGSLLKIDKNLVRYYCLSEEERKGRNRKQHLKFMEKSLEERQKIYQSRSEYGKEYYQKLKKGLLQ